MNFLKPTKTTWKVFFGLLIFIVPFVGFWIFLIFFSSFNHRDYPCIKSFEEITYLAIIGPVALLSRLGFPTISAEGFCLPGPTRLGWILDGVFYLGLFYLLGCLTSWIKATNNSKKAIAIIGAIGIVVFVLWLFKKWNGCLIC